MKWESLELNVGCSWVPASNVWLPKDPLEHPLLWINQGLMLLLWRPWAGHTDLPPSSKSRLPISGFHPKVMKVAEIKRMWSPDARFPIQALKDEPGMWNSGVWSLLLLLEARNKIKAASTCSVLLLFTLHGVADLTKGRSEEYIYCSYHKTWILKNQMIFQSNVSNNFTVPYNYSLCKLTVPYRKPPIFTGISSAFLAMACMAMLDCLILEMIFQSWTLHFEGSHPHSSSP